MSKNELIDLAVQPIPPLTIDSNLEDVKQSLILILDEYQNITFTTETMSEAKSVRARLNKLKKAINDEKIKVKKEFESPYKTFEGNMIDLIKLVEQPAEKIDAQIKLFEESKKEDRKIFIDTLFQEMKAELNVSLNVVYKDSWLLSSTTESKIKKEMEASFQEISGALTYITEKSPMFKDELSTIILNGGTLLEVMNKEKELQAVIDKAKARAEEQSKADIAKDEEKAIEPETAPIVKEMVKAFPTATVEQTDLVEAVAAKTSEEILTTTLKITYKRSDGFKFKQAMIDCNIKFEKI